MTLEAPEIPSVTDPQVTAEVATPVSKYAHVVIKYPYIEMLSMMVTRPISKTMYDELELALIPLREFAEGLKDVRFNFEAFSTWRPEGRPGNVKTNVYFSRLTDEAPSLDEIEKVMKGKGFKFFKRYPGIVYPSNKK